jgi:serine protease
VRSARIMHSDGVVYDGDLLIALGILIWQVSDGLAVLDVLSLSLGYFEETEADSQYTAFALRGLLAKLIDLGVTIVAAAGNNATSRPFYPAALAGSRWRRLQQIVSVGALNPNGTKALFSNDGDWVNTWDSGAALVSTYPRHLQGSFTPSARSFVKSKDHARETVDVDSFGSGFVVWSGTSFAAPLVAARLVAALANLAGGPGDSRSVIRARAQTALGTVSAELKKNAKNARDLAKQVARS